jgi:tricorn protease
MDPRRRVCDLRIRQGKRAYARIQFYKVHIDGGFPQALPVPRAVAGDMSPDGRYMAYQEVGFWDPEWRNYRAGQAKPVWIMDLQDHSLVTTLQTDGERHMNPIWHNGKVFFISERDFAANIWSFDPSPWI